VEPAFATVAGWIAQSDFRQTVLDLLMNVPGLPPLVQAVHILSIGVVVASLVMPNLKVLGLAATGQNYSEMLHRLRPWALTALFVLFLSGAMFVIARPYRYFSNPVVGVKFACLAGALAMTWIAQHRAKSSAPLFGLGDRTLAALAVIAWLGVIFAGRWIAYVDYLFWEE
jgi:hypothetical protein